MRNSELTLLALFNQNNHVGLTAEQLTFSAPRVVGGAWNTAITATAVASDATYAGAVVLHYNRRHAKDLFPTGLVLQSSVLGGVVSDLVDKLVDLGLPTDASELVVRALVRHTSALYTLSVEFKQHPLIVGNLTLSVALPTTSIASLVTRRQLTGFTESQILPPSLIDIITVTELPGFQL